MISRTTFHRSLTIALLAAALTVQHAAAIEICTGGNRAERKVTCLVDGDTGWEQGVKWRLSDVDTPEYHPHAECAQEVEFAKSATYRMRDLLAGGYELEWLGINDGSREIVRIRLRNGRDVGDVLLEEGHAVKWPHPPKVWCPPN